MISKFLGCFVFAVFAFGASHTYASDTLSDGPSIVPGETQDSAVVEAVQGNAHFEQHHTIVPLVCTQDYGCPKSQPYWTLVVNSAGVTYELDAQFDLGSETPPSAVTVLGVVVPSGALVSVEGVVEYTGDHYVLLNELRNIGIVRANYSQAVVSSVSAPIIANFLNWSCRGQLDDKTKVLAEIWFAGSETDQENRYHVRVSASKEQGATRQFYNIGYVDNAHISRASEQLIYDGKGSDVSLRVAIQNSGVIRDVPGTLNLSSVQSVLDQGLPVVDQVNLLCNRTR